MKKIVMCLVLIGVVIVGFSIHPQVAYTATQVGCPEPKYGWYYAFGTDGVLWTYLTVTNYSKDTVTGPCIGRTKVYNSWPSTYEETYGYYSDLLYKS